MSKGQAAGQRREAYIQDTHISAHVLEQTVASATKLLAFPRYFVLLVENGRHVADEKLVLVVGEPVERRQGGRVSIDWSTAVGELGLRYVLCSRSASDPTSSLVRVGSLTVAG